MTHAIPWQIGTAGIQKSGIWQMPSEPGHCPEFGNWV